VANEDAVATPIGVDMGLKTFAILDNGDQIHSLQYLKESLSRLRSRSKRLSRKKRGPRHRRDARRQVAKLRRRVADQRRDWAFKTAHALCDQYDGIAIEEPAPSTFVPSSIQFTEYEVGFVGFAEVCIDSPTVPAPLPVSRTGFARSLLGWPLLGDRFATAPRARRVRLWVYLRPIGVLVN
jgi:Probable transposase